MHYYLLSNGEKYTNTINAWDRVTQLFPNDSYGNIRLCLYDGAFDKVLWNSIPIIHIRTAEDLRAKQIRQKYSYVRILYSAGSDSQTVLDAFIRNNLYVDEIVIVSSCAFLDSDISSVANKFLVEQQARDSYMKSTVPIGKITHADVTKRNFDDYFSEKYYENCSGLGAGGRFNFNQFTEVAYKLSPPPVTDYVDVLGMEKPRLYSDNKKVWWKFYDKEVIYNHYSNDGKPIEWFFLSDQCPELIISQCHGALSAAMRIAKAKKIELSEALVLLQKNTEYYDIWCKSLGRTSSSYMNSLSVASKPTEKTRSIYKHFEYYQEANNIQWRNFQTLRGIIRDIVKTDDVFYGVPTNEYVFHHLH